ncbi:MAG: hypothetical protein ACO1RX_17565 [Candidatus Sericytochromatia bacterium]
MRKTLQYLTLSLLVAGALSGCDRLQEAWERPAKAIDKLEKENRKLEQEVVDLKEKVAKAEAEGQVNTILVALYDLRHALEKYAQQNEGQYPVADNVEDLQVRIKSYLPETFAIEPTYLERVRSQQKGYIMIARVKGREIVVSNLL